MNETQISFFSDYLTAAIRLSIPLGFAALGGMWSERSGVLNIALEGMLLTGAFVSASVAFISNNAWLGLIIGTITGGLVGLLHAYFSVTLKINQIVSALGINLSVTGLTAFLSRIIFSRGNINTLPNFSFFEVLNRSKLQWFLFPENLFILLLILLIIASSYLLFYTNFGLSVRAVGQYPLAAETAGISVDWIRYGCVLLSGILCGLGGAYLALVHIQYFAEGIVAGKGYIALAAVIFGRWHPLGIMGACFLFGATEALQLRIQTFNLNIPYQFLNMLPYLVALLALLGLGGKASPPTALGVAYNKESRD
ncbi:putative inner-membrane translocator [Crocosphaera subtropica ATCC 51142]|uniref:Inner-membrane translocator n=1 Tax=Crocosphaera subtropica (strain ATCC 51142 / BH68) TaxID=43989 RepID=B1X095_CROS5|nr:ABC transporter permease [Crocosphaera subtropica]ACB49596.1 putative inner-membrane translocator [Crocosphaera subtropica ATCC 51142]